MTRPRLARPDPPQAEAKPQAPPEPHVIDPHGIYFPDQAQILLRLTRSTIRREFREGRLRIAKRAGRYYLLGKWLIEWIEGGELRRAKNRGADNGAVVD
jgi:hypothetical protein